MSERRRGKRSYGKGKRGRGLSPPTIASSCLDYNLRGRRRMDSATREEKGGEHNRLRKGVDSFSANKKTPRPGRIAPFLPKKMPARSEPADALDPIAWNKKKAPLESCPRKGTLLHEVVTLPEPVKKHPPIFRPYVPYMEVQVGEGIRFRGGMRTTDSKPKPAIKESNRSCRKQSEQGGEKETTSRLKKRKKAWTGEAAEKEMEMHHGQISSKESLIC